MEEEVPHNLHMSGVVQEDSGPLEDGEAGVSDDHLLHVPPGQLERQGNTCVHHGKLGNILHLEFKN